jgi:hypothetical protein
MAAEAGENPMNTINTKGMEKFLDGTATPEEISALDKMLRSSKEAREEMLVQAGMESQLRLIFAQAQTEAADQTPVAAPAFWRSSRWLWIPAAAAAAAAVWFAMQPPAVPQTASMPVVAKVVPIIKPLVNGVEAAPSTPVPPAPPVVAATGTGKQPPPEEARETPPATNERKGLDPVVVAQVARPQPPVVVAPVAKPVVAHSPAAPAPVVAAANQPANPVSAVSISDIPFSNSSGSVPQLFHPFNDATVVSLYSGTQIAASQNGQNQQVKMPGSGAVRLQVAKMASGAQLSVRTPLLTAYVRGTDFVVLNKGSSCWVADRSGSVDVVLAGTNNVSIHVAPGHCVKVTADSQPQVLPTTSSLWINQSRSTLGSAPYP